MQASPSETWTNCAYKQPSLQSRSSHVEAAVICGDNPAALFPRHRWVAVDGYSEFAENTRFMPALPAARGRPLILHVEDNKAQQDALKAILEGDGCTVLQASTADEALQLCRDTPISLVLADHMLSGSVGTELAGQIKALKPSVPIVLHSGSPPEKMRHLDGYIHKGESVRELLEFLRALIDRFWD